MESLAPLGHKEILGILALLDQMETRVLPDQLEQHLLFLAQQVLQEQHLRFRGLQAPRVQVEPQDQQDQKEQELQDQQDRAETRVRQGQQWPLAP